MIKSWPTQVTFLRVDYRHKTLLTSGRKGNSCRNTYDYDDDMEKFWPLLEELNQIHNQVKASLRIMGFVWLEWLLYVCYRMPTESIYTV